MAAAIAPLETIAESTLSTASDATSMASTSASSFENQSLSTSTSTLEHSDTSSIGNADDLQRSVSPAPSNDPSLSPTQNLSFYNSNMPGIRDYFNNVAQTNTNNTNDVLQLGKAGNDYTNNFPWSNGATLGRTSNNANSTFSNLFLGPRLALDPTINIGQQKQQPAQYNSVGSQSHPIF
nr:MAG: hypothetical protein [Wufeng shrew polycipivirus 3]